MKKIFTITTLLLLSACVDGNTQGGLSMNEELDYIKNNRQPEYIKRYENQSYYYYNGKRYPRYDPSADNPYYPQRPYNPQPPRYNNYDYRYPTFDPNADNPYYPPPNDSQFNKPLFDKPLFEN